MEFQISLKALFLVACLGVFLYFASSWHRKFRAPSLFFSSLESASVPTAKEKWSKAPLLLIWMALCAFILAFIDPHILLDRKHDLNRPPSSLPLPTEGIAIYLVLDQSGSMTEEVPVSFAGKRRISKIELVKALSTKFIEGDSELGLFGRPNDLIGLIFFARGAHVESPLTLDHGTVLQHLSQYDRVTNMNEDGTAIGYAIFKAVNLIAATHHYAMDLIKKGEPAYTIKNSIIILLTDGLQDPNPLDKGKRLRNMDIPETANYAKENHVRLYIVNVEPKLGTEEFAPYRHIMQRAAESTGGKFYMMQSSGNLLEIYKDIDSLEKSKIPAEEEVNKNNRPDLYQRISYSPYLIALGIFCLLISIILDAFFLRKIP